MILGIGFDDSFLVGRIALGLSFWPGGDGCARRVRRLDY